MDCLRVLSFAAYNSAAAPVLPPSVCSKIASLRTTPRTMRPRLTPPFHSSSKTVWYRGPEASCACCIWLAHTLHTLRRVLPTFCRPRNAARGCSGSQKICRRSWAQGFLHRCVAGGALASCRCCCCFSMCAAMLLKPTPLGYLPQYRDISSTIRKEERDCGNLWLSSLTTALP